MRTSLYIDGFNLYYRALKNSPYKWLDLKELARNLLQSHHTITRIKYFTAMVSGITDPRRPIRQKTYIRALKSHIAEFSAYYGHFLSHEISCPLSPLTNPPRFVRVMKTEEKGSDVNLAVHLLNDAWLDSYDCAVVSSNDSDLAEPLRLVREQNNKLIGLISPIIHGHPSRELQQHAHFVKRIRRGVLKVSQLPSPIPGTRIRKPPSW